MLQRQLGVQVDAALGREEHEVLGGDAQADVIAGLVVGISTRYGAGCTSGHGVCGLSRLSPRSMAATVAFMASGFVTVYVIRHLWGGL